MREAYLVNLSQSIISIPLYETSPVTIGGRTVQKTQYKSLVPKQEFPVGTDISVEKKKYYSQFRPILVELRFRQAEETPVEETLSEEEVETPVEETLSEEEVETSTEEGETPEKYDEAGLMKLRQAELIKIGTDMGLEVTTQDSKAEITKKILESQIVG